MSHNQDASVYAANPDYFEVSSCGPVMITLPMGIPRMEISVRNRGSEPVMIGEQEVRPDETYAVQ